MPVEITPEMIEAGCDALARFNSDYDREEDAIRWIYEAMESARVKGHQDDLKTHASPPQPKT